MFVQQFARKPADPGRRFLKNLVHIVHEFSFACRNAVSAKARVEQRRFPRAPSAFERPQTLIFEVGASHIEHSKTIFAAFLDRRPHQQIIRTIFEAFISGRSIFVGKGRFPV